MDEVDRDRLLSFVDATREDLLFIFDVSGRYLSPAVAELLWPAWESLESRDEFGTLQAAIASGDYDERLERVGLSGPELDFKLVGYETARTAGRETRAPRWLRRWLRWTDVILGSLLSAVGIGEGIKELKEGVEAELDPEEEEMP